MSATHAPASLVLLFIVALAPLTAGDRFGDVEITPLIHSSVQIEHAGKVIHVDPWSLGDLSRMKPADLIVITDDVGHHLDVKAIQHLRKPGAPVVIAANGKARVPDGIVLANGQRHHGGRVSKSKRLRPTTSRPASRTTPRARPTATSSPSAHGASTSPV